MLDFSFYNPTKIYFGASAFDAIAESLPAASKVLMTFGGGSIKKNGVYDKVKKALAPFSVIEFGGIEPNPTYETLMKAVQVVHEHQCTFLLAVGGGSVIDGTKFIAAASRLPTSEDPWRLLSDRAPLTNGALPFGAVLTLAATGSEMNMFSVVTRKKTKEKRGFGAPCLFPQFSILDPATTLSLPPTQTANGVVDAFVHVVEQYLTFPVNAPVQDRFAEGLLLTLIEEGKKVLKNPNDIETRGNIMWAATMALSGVVGSGVPQDWSTHMIGHELTAEFGIDHAKTLAIVLPSLLQEMKTLKKEKLLQYGERVWGLGSGTESQRIDEAISKTREFFETMGIKTRLSSYGVTSQAIPQLVQRLEEKNFVEMGEQKSVTLEVSEKILHNSI